jgi:Tfp pilus assembly major pilin PilA
MNNIKNLNLTQILIIILILFLIYVHFIKKDPVIEGMANVSGVTYEALQSLASMYKEGKLKVSDLEVTGNTTLHGLTTVKNELAIVNGGGIFGTHFNHQNKGGTYIRGTFINLDKAYNTDGKIYINGDLNVSGISNINGLTVKENANFNKVLNVHDRLWAKNRIDTGVLQLNNKIRFETANPQGHGDVLKLISKHHSKNYLLLGPQNSGDGYHITLGQGKAYYFNKEGRIYGGNRDDRIWG